MRAAPNAPPQPPPAPVEVLCFDRVEPMLPQLRVALRRGDVSGLAALLAATTELLLLARAALDRAEDPALGMGPVARITLRRALASATLGMGTPSPPIRRRRQGPRGAVRQ